MAGNPACEHFVPLLSPYIDGELPPAERVNVERHLVVCRNCTGRAADLRAESGLVRVGLEMAADEVDFKHFAQAVMARITPEKPPLFERWRLSLSEMLRYQRTAFVSSLATAAVLLLVGLPFLLRERVPEGYAPERMSVQAVHTHEEAKVKPVLLASEDGTSIIWLVDPPSPGDASTPEESRGEALEVDEEAQPVQKPKVQTEHPKGGEL